MRKSMNDITIVEGPSAVDPGPVNLHIEILAREEGGILEIKIRICGDFAKEGREREEGY